MLFFEINNKKKFLGSTPKKLIKPDALPTQDLPIDQFKIQSDLISTSAINQSSMEHTAIKQV